jgi:hypothetical protein
MTQEAFAFLHCEVYSIIKVERLCFPARYAGGTDFKLIDLSNIWDLRSHSADDQWCGCTNIYCNEGV